jgi:Holliday junction resolvase RusA-like endonuclease
MISFIVLGKPEPAGSKRALPFAGKRGMHPIVVDANRKAAPWKAHVAATARQAYSGPLLQGPLEMSLRFVVVRPGGHYSKATGKLLPSAPPCPTVKPDLLKLARGVEDALSGVIYRDDALIVIEHLIKVYGEPASVQVEVSGPC